MLDRETRPSNLVLYIVSLNHFMNDGSTNLIASLFPAAILAFGFSKFEVGILIATGYLVNMIFQPMTGKYSERFESMKLMALGISLIGVSMILFIVSSTFVLMLLSILVLRFGSSFFHPVGVSTISRSYSGAHLDRAMGIQSAFGNLGILMVFLVSAPIYLAFGWHAPFLIYAAFDALTVSTTLIVFSKVKFGRSQVRDPVEKVKSTEARVRLGLPIFFIAASFISGGSFAVFSNFGNIRLSDESFGLSASNFIMAAWVLSAFFGAILTGYLTRRLTRKTILPLSFFLSSVSALAFVMLSDNALLIAASLLVNGFFVSITYPATYSELSAHLGSNKPKGAAFGILFSSQIAGASILGLLSGYIAQNYSLSLPFEIVFVLLGLASVFAYVWTRRA